MSSNTFNYQYIMSSMKKNTSSTKSLFSQHFSLITIYLAHLFKFLTSLGIFNQQFFFLHSSLFFHQSFLEKHLSSSHPKQHIHGHSQIFCHICIIKSFLWYPVRHKELNHFTFYTLHTT